MLTAFDAMTQGLNPTHRKALLRNYLASVRSSAETVSFRDVPVPSPSHKCATCPCGRQPHPCGCTEQG